jgi:glutamate racemase
MNKDRLSIVIIDSGLGGLSICADMVNSLNQRRNFKDVALTYFNAWPEQSRGYNLLPGMAERIRVFDRALIGMQRFEPDVILIACNTLSALYSHTAFIRNASIPVIDIIDFGVQMIYAQLISQPDSRVIIFGTPTTIEANAHKTRLIDKGIPADRIILQPCDRLAGEIEKNPESETVREMIDRYVSQAPLNIRDTRLPVLAAFCCTHYEYSHTVFKEKLEEYFEGNVSILNPNKAMSAYLFADKEHKRHSTVHIDLKVVSRIVWSDMKVASISNVLEAVSPVTAEALRQYQHDPELFTF